MSVTPKRWRSIRGPRHTCSFPRRKGRTAESPKTSSVSRSATSTLTTSSTTSSNPSQRVRPPKRMAKRTKEIKSRRAQPTGMLSWVGLPRYISIFELEQYLSKYGNHCYLILITITLCTIIYRRKSDWWRFRATPLMLHTRGVRRVDTGKDPCDFGLRTSPGCSVGGGSLEHLKLIHSNQGRGKLP